MYCLLFAMRPEFRFGFHKRNFIPNWFVICCALCANSPEQRCHAALPDLQQGSANVGLVLNVKISTLDQIFEFELADWILGSHFYFSSSNIFTVLFILLDMFLFMHSLTITCKVCSTSFDTAKIRTEIAQKCFKKYTLIKLLITCQK